MRRRIMQAVWGTMLAVLLFFAMVDVVELSS